MKSLQGPRTLLNLPRPSRSIKIPKNKHTKCAQGDRTQRCPFLLVGWEGILFTSRKDCTCSSHSSDWSEEIVRWFWSKILGDDRRHQIWLSKGVRSHPEACDASSILQGSCSHWWRRTNGIIQGCPLSMMTLNTIVAAWLEIRTCPAPQSSPQLRGWHFSDRPTAVRDWQNIRKVRQGVEKSIGICRSYSKSKLIHLNQLFDS